MDTRAGISFKEQFLKPCKYDEMKSISLFTLFRYMVRLVACLIQNLRRIFDLVSIYVLIFIQWVESNFCGSL